MLLEQNHCFHLAILAQSETDIWSLESGQRLATLSATANLQTDLEGPPLVYDLGLASLAHVAQSVGPAQSVAISVSAPGSAQHVSAVLANPLPPNRRDRLTRKNRDVFGDDEPQYRPVKNEQASFF